MRASWEIQAKVTKKTEAETVKQQLVALAKKESTFLSKQEQVDTRVAALFGEIGTESQRISFKRGGTWVAPSG